jgi:lipoprotein NlpI
VAKLGELLRLEPENARAFYIRGRENFRLGRVKEAVADFDRYVKLVPDAEPRQWERGIAMYYAGEFARGARQFELYQTFDDRDVENSVWRFLCMAREQGVEKARAVMLPIKKDSRVPMMQVFELYRGTIEPEQVLQAARAGEPAAEVLAARLFYAHLYLGLYHEATGDIAQARKFIEHAADKKLQHAPRINGYMWDVASVHWQRMLAEKK